MPCQCLNVEAVQIEAFHRRMCTTQHWDVSSNSSTELSHRDHILSCAAKVSFSHNFEGLALRYLAARITCPPRSLPLLGRMWSAIVVVNDLEAGIKRRQNMM